MEVQVENGYELHALKIFNERLETLVSEVEALESSDEHFYEHPSFKLMSCVLDAITLHVPSDPTAREYNLGGTLDSGKSREFRSWKRVKKRLPARYRLFFKFNTNQPKTIIYAWLNDESTLRKDGARTDVYHCFVKMLKSGTVPNDWAELLAEAEHLKHSA